MPTKAVETLRNPTGLVSDAIGATAAAVPSFGILVRRNPDAPPCRIWAHESR